MRNQNRHPQWHGHHQQRGAQPGQRVNHPVQAQGQRQVNYGNLPPPVILQQPRPVFQGGQRPRGAQGVGIVQNANNAAPAAGIGPLYQNQQAHLNIPNRGYRINPGNMQPQPPQMRNLQRDQMGYRINQNMTGAFQPRPQHMMSGYGRVPLNLQQQGPRSIP